MALARCFSTLGCPDASLDEAAAIARRHGMSGLEIRALAGTTELARLWSEQFEAPAALATYARSRGIRVLAIGTSLHLVGGTNAERVELCNLAPWADALGVPRIRVFDGGKNAAAYPAAEAADTFRWWAEQRRKNRWSVDLMVETHDALLTADAIVRFLDRVPAASILWDAHHTWRKGGEDPAVTWRRVGHRVVHVHVKDSIPVPSAKHPFTYVLPGDGGFPVGAVMAELRRGEFAGPVSFEWEKKWHPYLPPLEQALATAAARGWW